MNPAREKHIKYNRATADRWRDFEEHRKHVMALLCQDAAPGSSLCVLGAGNCNDLDLGLLMQSFGEVHLFDIDEHAMQTGVTRQGVDSDQLILHSGIDLGGFFHVLDEGGDADACRSAIDAFECPADCGPYDVVASVCLLSQLKHSLFLRFAQDEKNYSALCDAIRRRHYQVLQGLLRPGGHGVLITDFTSSDLYPALSTCADEAFEETAAAALAAGRCFHRNAPALLEEDLERVPDVGDLQALPHWRWMIWPTHFAVCGFSWRRTPGP